ncbi:hypothetical protein ADL27_36565, partial [Streptomyces sp. NRRL F-6602]
AERVRENTGGAGADVAIEISGVYPALHEALRSVTVGGRVVASGFYQGDGAGLRLGDEFHHNRVQLVCSQIGGVPPQLSGRWSVERLQRTFLRLVAELSAAAPWLMELPWCSHTRRPSGELRRDPADLGADELDAVVVELVAEA